MIEDLAHRPTPEFRHHLEQEVRRAIRRDRRRIDAPRPWRAGWARAAVIVAVSIAIGTTAGFASAQIRDGARRDSLLQVARAEADLAALRLQLARERFADATKKVQIGMLSATSLGDAQAELRAMEARAMRSRYDIEEITASAQPPRDDLNAPLVGGRDFVRDRLRLEALAAQERFTAAEAAQAEAERRVRIGAVGDIARLDANVDVARARAALAVVARQLDFRKEFVEKQTPIDQLLRRLDELQLRADADVAQQALVAARERLSTIDRQHGAGAAGDVELMKAQLEAKEREYDLQRVTLRLQALGRVKRDSVP